MEKTIKFKGNRVLVKVGEDWSICFKPAALVNMYNVGVIRSDDLLDALCMYYGRVHNFCADACYRIANKITEGVILRNAARMREIEKS